MPDLIPGFRTADGMVHTNYLSAIKHELLAWLKETSDNEVGAKKIVEAINAETIGGIAEMFQAIQEEINNPATFEIISGRTQVAQQ